jgi:FAD/FMN-containing dehydrogenase
VPPNDYAYNEKLGCKLGGLPVYVINATNAEQISIAAKWASLRNLRIIVKGTGHDLNGR